MLQKILSNMRKAIEDYRMIENGDHIAVGVSGGKDSLILLMALKELQRFLPVTFRITAVTISLGFPDFDVASLIAFYQRLGVAWHIEETNIGHVVFETRNEKNPCALCAKMKRGTIHETARKLGCNKVAFGHHMDDAIETLMMSLIYEGRLHCFSPVTYLSRSEVTLIRPLIYVEERQIRACVRSEGIMPIKSGCPAEGKTKRATVKTHIASLKTENPTIRASLFGAIQRAGLNGWKIMGNSSQYKKGHPDLPLGEDTLVTQDVRAILAAVVPPSTSPQKDLEEELNRSHARQALILGMLLQLYHPADLGQSYLNVLGLVGQHLNIDRVSLFTCQYDGSLRLRQEWNTQEAHFTGKGTRHLPDHRSKALSRLADWMKTRSHYDTGEMEDAPGPDTDAKPEILHPWAAQTLRMADRPVSVLLFEDFHSGRVWSEEDRTTLDAAAFIMTMAHERRQTEIALQTATRKAQEASLTKGRFLANMSHELRTPMNAILGYMDLMETTQVSGEQQEYIREAKIASGMLLFLINDVLDYSKIEAGHLSLERVPFDLRNCVEHAVVMQLPKAQEKGVEIGILVDPSLPETVMGDPSRLDQILTNLISNAIKFTARGDVLVEVLPEPEETAPGTVFAENSSGSASIAADLFPYLAFGEVPGQMHMLIHSEENHAAESSDGAEVRLVIRVSDSGIGMSGATIRQLYQPFTQADSSTTRQFGGTGLGLAITHRLVQMMLGRISVESREGEGSSFSCHIAFPLPADESESGRVIPPIHALQGHGRVLVIEDSRMQSRILCHYLASAGYACTMAGSAVEALSRMTDGTRYDAILLSTAMSDYPVPAVIELLRNLPAGSDVPILLLSTFARREPYAVRQGDRIQGTLTRPYRYRELLLHMKAVLERVSADATTISGNQPVHHQDGPVQLQMPGHAGPDVRKVGTGNDRFSDRFKDPDQPETTVTPHDDSLPSVLLVEDNLTNRTVFVSMLRVYGLPCDTANDGMEAVRACERNAYDIIFMDCQMPVLDGFAAARTIRGAGSSRKAVIIALTAHTMAGDRDRCLDAGMDDHVGKPFTMAILFARLDKLMLQMGYARPAKPLPLSAWEPVVSMKKEIPAENADSTETGEPEAPDSQGWPEEHPATVSIRSLMQIPGFSRKEVTDLIHLFLRELAGTIKEQPDMETEAFLDRVHRHRGSAGSLQLNGFHRRLTDLESAAREGDQATVQAALKSLQHMHDDWMAESGTPVGE